MNDNFMYGVGAVRYNGEEVGYIGKNSFDLGGQKPESTDIEAEQVPGAPVLVIPTANGKIAPKFDLIQLNFATLQKFLGGKLITTGSKTTGWTAPRSAMVLEGAFELALVSGQSILIPAATLLANLGGKLTLTETAKLEVELKVTMPTKAGEPPYGVFESASLPDEWKTPNWELPVETTTT